MDFLNSPHRVLGIDPGKSGAVAVIGRGKFEVRRDFKTFADIAYAVQALSEGVTHVVMELVHAYPGQGVVSCFTFGKTAGIAQGALALALPAVEIEEPAPHIWQKFYRQFLSLPKEADFDSRSLATRLFPCASASYLKRVKDHNTGDAILLALWKHYQLRPPPEAVCRGWR